MQFLKKLSFLNLKFLDICQKPEVTTVTIDRGLEKNLIPFKHIRMQVPKKIIISLSLVKQNSLLTYYTSLLNVVVG